ncbi:hypothetical protein, partial [Geomicrobium sp. JCM 19037]|uniref:hypothetical protein n=1 Tax=Geomicrobium sp. JCM 19037 TaxID=1460634 RepID=UPI001EE6926C
MNHNDVEPTCLRSRRRRLRHDTPSHFAQIERLPHTSAPLFILLDLYALLIGDAIAPSNAAGHSGE